MDRETFLKSDRMIFFPIPFEHRAWVYAVDDNHRYWGYSVSGSLVAEIQNDDFAGEPELITPLFGICDFEPLSEEEDEEDE